MASPGVERALSWRTQRPQAQPHLLGTPTLASGDGAGAGDGHVAPAVWGAGASGEAGQGVKGSQLVADTKAPFIAAVLTGDLGRQEHHVLPGSTGRQRGSR